ncbi:hypothetical protein DY000_02020495 [Brassica cretica]|uniref:Uncharacterized protein n=1 Tax=Brassica cretica TaxID=69181 RepID=A0ABQ7EFZ5_BRACR|nr:hypothetical protein DY000_02020495 [Brassica cretica]
MRKVLRNEEGGESVFKEETRSGFSKLLQTFSENLSKMLEWNVEQLSPQISLPKPKPRPRPCRANRTAAAARPAGSAHGESSLYLSHLTAHIT